jgi:hypothetical protein
MATDLPKTHQHDHNNQQQQTLNHASSKNSSSSRKHGHKQRVNNGGIVEASSGLQFVLLRQRVAQEMDKAGYSTVLVLLDVCLSLLSVLLYIIMTYGLLVQVGNCAAHQQQQQQAQ